MLRKLVATMSLSALLVMPMAANAQDATEAPMMGAGIESVCLVTDVGKVNDGTFNQFAYEGMQKAAADFGLKNTYIETQAQTDYANNIDTCVSEGYDAIVTVGFLIADATQAAAAANPDVYFMGVDEGFATPLPNLVGIQFREDQAGFLVGALAALTTKSGTIAGIYGIAIPPVVKYRNGYEQGAKYINPDIKTLGVYIDNFNAPDRGATAAEQFVGEGADVIFGAGGPTGSGGIVRAAALKVSVIGVDQDEYLTTFGNGETPGAQYLISSAEKRVDNGVYNTIESLVNGEALPEDSAIVYSAENGGVDFAPPHDSTVPQDVEDQVATIRDGLKDGSIETGVDPVSGELLSEEMMTPEATPAS